MAEPETLLIEGARLATSTARRLWTRTERAGDTRVLLADVRVRLEAFLAALWGVGVRILPSDPAPPPTWLARVVGRAPGHLVPRQAIPSTDGVRIWLPRELERASGLATYRVLAVEQAARVRRETAGSAPADTLERDLYELAEAVAVDCALCAELPGLREDLLRLRAAALRDRPSRSSLTALERLVEDLVCHVLSSEPIAAAPVPVLPSPIGSRTWAMRTAARLRQRSGRYRGIAAVQLWGRLTADPALPCEVAPDEPAGDARDGRRARLRRAPTRRGATDEDRDRRAGTWMIKPDADMESAEDGAGLRRPADQHAAADTDELADAVSDLEQLSTVRSPARAREVLESDALVPARTVSPPIPLGPGIGIVYPEWDYRLNGYRARAITVRPGTAPAGGGAWVDRVMREHAALVHRVRRRFDGLRPRRLRVPEQVDGTDIDVAAYVNAFADWHAGQPVPDRLYVAERPGRRDLAMLLLVDVSASTDAWVDGRRRVIDLEKEALIVLLEALDALGDPHAVLAFSGRGPRDVRLLTVKEFRDRVGPDVRRRVAALDADDYTRVGAAIRHATALLARQPARRRLLLILSDGKPNDVDEYEGRYGVEDTRRAVTEARSDGVLPFCLTVDRNASASLASIFGRTGYAMLPRPALLPSALAEVVRQLITR